MKTFQKYNKKDISRLFKILDNSYKKIKKNKIKKHDNLILILFHELVYFFSTLISNKNIRFFNNPTNNIFINKNINFGERNKKNILIKSMKDRNNFFLFLIKIFNMTIFRFYKKKLFYGFGLKLNLFEKFIILISSFFFGYKIELVGYIKLSLPKYDLQKKILYEAIFLINKTFKLKINKNSYKTINSFLDKIFLEKKIDNEKIKHQRNIYLMGTSANLINRLNSVKGLKEKNKVYIFGHDLQTGISNHIIQKYDDYSFCTNYVGFTTKERFGRLQKTNLKDVDNKKPLFHKKKYLIKTKKIFSGNFDLSLLKYKKGIYLPRKFTPYYALSPDEIIDFEKYIKWQNFLMKQFLTLDYKIHPKNQIRFDKIKHLLKFNFDRIKKGKISKIINKYDYIILDFVTTTAFSDVANLNKPIVYFNIGIDSVTKLGATLIKQRTFQINLDINNDEYVNSFKGLYKIKRKNYTNKNINHYIS